MMGELSKFFHTITQSLVKAYQISSGSIPRDHLKNPQNLRKGPSTLPRSLIASFVVFAVS